MSKATMNEHGHVYIGGFICDLADDEKAALMVQQDVPGASTNLAAYAQQASEARRTGYAAAYQIRALRRALGLA